MSFAVNTSQYDGRAVKMKNGRRSITQKKNKITHVTCDSHGMKAPLTNGQPSRNQHEHTEFHKGRWSLVFFYPGICTGDLTQRSMYWFSTSHTTDSLQWVNAHISINMLASKHRKAKDKTKMNRKEYLNRACSVCTVHLALIMKGYTMPFSIH